MDIRLLIHAGSKVNPHWQKGAHGTVQLLTSYMNFADTCWRRQRLQNVDASSTWCYRKFFTYSILSRNINIYLQFRSLLHTDMTRVVEILPHVIQGPTYSTLSISWLLMTWRHKEGQIGSSCTPCKHINLYFLKACSLRIKNLQCKHVNFGRHSPSWAIFERVVKKKYRKLKKDNFYMPTSRFFRLSKFASKYMFLCF